jgi:hypothetical protein
MRACFGISDEQWIHIAPTMAAFVVALSGWSA